MSQIVIAVVDDLFFASKIRAVAEAVAERGAAPVLGVKSFSPLFTTEMVCPAATFWSGWA